MTPPPEAATADEINRLWQHGMHEERLFHDRLNYFSALQIGLLSVSAILHNKEPSLGVALPLAGVALLFTLLWLAIQVRHWAYCVHVNEQIKRLVPEYRRTVAAFAGRRHADGLSISKPLALAVPALFAAIWVAFLAWLLLRPSAGEPGGAINLDRLALAAVVGVLAWTVLRLLRAERRLRALEERADPVPFAATGFGPRPDR